MKTWFSWLFKKEIKQQRVERSFYTKKEVKQGVTSTDLVKEITIQNIKNRF